MRRLVLTFSISCLLACCGQAQTVQLPTYRVFSTSGTVVVPDRGSTYIGGVNRSASSSIQRRGLLPSRGFGNSTSAGGVSVSAYIHDFEAMDAAILAAAERRNPRPLSTQTANGTLSRRRTAQRSLTSVSAQRQAVGAEQQRQQNLAKQDYELAQGLLAKGKVGAAKILLRNARRRSDASMRKQIDKQFAALENLATKTVRAASLPTRRSNQ